jgi:hypothetical protein
MTRLEKEELLIQAAIWIVGALAFAAAVFFTPGCAGDVKQEPYGWSPDAAIDGPPVDPCVPPLVACYIGLSPDADSQVWYQIARCVTPGDCYVLLGAGH